MRAAVLGANDGLISTSGLIVGVAAAQTAREPVLLATVAGLVAGALSMAAGEYVSVSSQADTERANLEGGRAELAASPGLEHAELAGIYVGRGDDSRHHRPLDGGVRRGGAPTPGVRTRLAPATAPSTSGA